jgi:Sap, sulfolipid-1-addressing protein
MIFEVLGRLLPIAVAVAISSVPITATIMILLSPNQRRSSLPFLIGWILGIAAMIVIFTLGAAAIPARATAHPQEILAIAQIVIGLALEAFALILWRRSAEQPSQELPRWLRAVGSLRGWQALGLAFVLNVRPKSILLSAAAGLSMRTQPLTVGESVVAIAVYTVISASTVGIPVIFTLAAPKKAEPRLIIVRDWIVKNNRIVTILIMVMIGFVIIGNGLTRL